MSSALADNAAFLELLYGLPQPTGERLEQEQNQPLLQAK
jgi:hypothetical protein